MLAWLLLFGVTPSRRRNLRMIFLTAIGSILFCSIGFIIVNLCARPPAATAIANMVFLVMLFLSGSTFPKAVFPAWLSNAAQILPASHLFDLSRGALDLYYWKACSTTFEKSAEFAVLL